MCVCVCVCTISKDIGIKKEEEICMPKEESISWHRCERTNVAARIMDVKEQILHANVKCKTVNLDFMGIIHMCIQFQYWR